MQEQPPGAMSLLDRLVRLYPALAVGPFRQLWLGMLPSGLAWQMSVVAAGYAAFVLSGSATILGVVSMAAGLPLLLLSLPGGVVADRFPRRLVLLSTQTILGLLSGLMALLALTNRLEVWHLVALSAAQGASFAFNIPARQALASELVDRRLLRNAAALSAAGMNFSRIVGPSLGGALMAIPAIGVGGVFVLMTFLYSVVLATLWRLPRPSSTESGEASARATPRGTGWGELMEGLRYLGSSPTLLLLLLLAFLPIFFGMPYVSLMPLFAEDVFEVGAAGLGALLAANGIGALFGSVVVAGLSSVRRPALLQLGLGIVFGVGLMVFSLAPAFAVAVLALLVVGFASSGYWALNNGLVLAHSEPRLHGRVMSVYSMTFGLAPIAALPAAAVADLVGGPLTMAGLGLTVTLAIGGVALFYPPARQLK